MLRASESSMALSRGEGADRLVCLLFHVVAWQYSFPSQIGVPVRHDKASFAHMNLEFFRNCKFRTILQSICYVFLDIVQKSNFSVGFTCTILHISIIWVETISSNLKNLHWPSLRGRTELKLWRISKSYKKCVNIYNVIVQYTGVFLWHIFIRLKQLAVRLATFWASMGNMKCISCFHSNP